MSTTATLRMYNGDRIKVYGTENEHGEIVPLDVENLTSGKTLPRDVWMNDETLYNRIINSLRRNHTS